jgi:hypothetical protein
VYQQQSNYTTPLEPAAEFPALFDPSSRARICELVHAAARAGERDPAMILGAVTRELNRRTVMAATAGDTASLRAAQELRALYQRAVADHQAEALAYASRVVAWVALPPHERRRHQRVRSEAHRREFRAQKPPTEPQLALLRKLGYDGPEPENLVVASETISGLLAAKRAERRPVNSTARNRV